MPQPSYIYGVARIRALETRLVTRDRIERMLEAQSASDSIKVLSETEYGLGIAEMTAASDYEELLANEIRKVKRLIDEISTEPQITDLFFLKYDFHNLKVLLKARYLNQDGKELLSLAGVIPAEKLERAVSDRDYRDLPAFVKDALEELENALSLKVDPQKIDVILDRAMYDYIFSVCRKKRNRFVHEYFTIQADLINIRSLLRVKRMGESLEFLKGVLLPYGSLEYSLLGKAFEEPLEQFAEKMVHSRYGRIIAQGVQSLLRSDNLTVYERLMDDYLLDFVRSKKGNSFGIEPIIGYLLAKENEVKLIRMIMVGKTNNIPAEKIRERLRDVYV